MGYMRIHCSKCRRRWAVYDRDNWLADAARTCPNCGEQVDDGVWEKEVLPAFASMRDANMELHKHHLGWGATRFKIDFIA